MKGSQNPYYKVNELSEYVTIYFESYANWMSLFIGFGKTISKNIWLMNDSCYL